MIKKNIDNFSASQLEAIPKIKEFLKSPVTNDINTRVFILKGKAGTGKTTLIKYALDDMLTSDFNNINKNSISDDMYNLPNVIGVTLSHKAKSVLNNSIHVCKTFASTFGLKQTYGDFGEVSFEKIKSNSMILLPCEMPIKVFVHDECSMYDFKMLNYVLNDTNKSSKIIFMGDAGQLPPITAVDDNDSPTFDIRVADSNKHELLERHRQTKDNPILSLSDIIYEEIFGSQNIQRVLDAFAKESLIDGKGHTVIRYQDFLKHYKAISTDYTDTKVVAYRNDRVNAFNQQIRSFIHNKPDKPFIPGEIIYMNDTFIKKTKVGFKKTEINYYCYNSDEYVIDEVLSDEIDNIKCDMIKIDKKGHAHLLDAFLDVMLPVVCKSNQSEFNKKCSSMAHYAKNAESFKKGEAWKRFYTFKEQFANVSYGYCYTGHKIQGSGYKNIYVDVNDIMTVGPITDKRKLQALYTASTRATDLLIALKQ